METEKDSRTEVTFKEIGGRFPREQDLELGGQFYCYVAGTEEEKRFYVRSKESRKSAGPNPLRTFWLEIDEITNGMRSFILLPEKNDGRIDDGVIVPKNYGSTNRHS